MLQEHPLQSGAVDKGRSCPALNPSCPSLHCRLDYKSRPGPIEAGDALPIRKLGPAIRARQTDGEAKRPRNLKQGRMMASAGPISGCRGRHPTAITASRRGPTASQPQGAVMSRKYYGVLR